MSNRERGRQAEDATTKDLHEQLFAVSSDVRYVAVARGGQVELRSRPGIENSSSSESDLYEELLVNPTLITLARQRGQIDCGGLRYLIVGYGNFHQLVVPLPDGHASVAIELDADASAHLPAVVEVLEGLGADGS